MPSTSPPLSDRAKRCLGRGERNRVPDGLDCVRDELSAAGVPIFDPVVNGFFHYGGYSVPIGRKDTFQVHPVRDAIKSLRCIGNRNESPDQFRIAVGRHPTAQMWFLMDGFGRMFANDTPIADSLTQWIESCALEEMVARWNNSTRMVFLEDSVAAIRKWADQNLRRFSPASSRASAWWLSPQSALNIFLPWATQPGTSKWAWFFATTPNEADRLMERIRRSTGIEPQSVCSWPP